MIKCFHWQGALNTTISGDDTENSATTEPSITTNIEIRNKSVTETRGNEMFYDDNEGTHVTAVKLLNVCLLFIIIQIN